MKKTIDFKHSDKLEFIFVCPYCDDEEGVYTLEDIMIFRGSNQCGSCGKCYDIKMPNIQYHVKGEI